MARLYSKHWDSTWQRRRRHCSCTCNSKPCSPINMGQASQAQSSTRALGGVPRCWSRSKSEEMASVHIQRGTVAMPPLYGPCAPRVGAAGALGGWAVFHTCSWNFWAAPGCLLFSSCILLYLDRYVKYSIKSGEMKKGNFSSTVPYCHLKGQIILVLFNFPFAVLRIEPGASCMLARQVLCRSLIPPAQSNVFNF